MTNRKRIEYTIAKYEEEQKAKLAASKEQESTEAATAALDGVAAGAIE